MKNPTSIKTKSFLSVSFRLLLLSAFFIQVNNACAQSDTSGLQPKIKTEKSSLKVDSFPPHSARKAAIFSAVLPGAGQFYNKRYWKIPVVYAGLGTFAYLTIVSIDSLRQYSKAYQDRTDDNPATIDPYTKKYSDASLKQIRDRYRKDRDFAFLAFAAFYLLNIVDANVDAHLFRFRIDKDLSLRVMPDMRSYGGNVKPYLTLSLHF